MRIHIYGRSERRLILIYVENCNDNSGDERKYIIDESTDNKEIERSYLLPFFFR